MPLSKDSLFPFGKYLRTRVEDVPASYLMWAHGEIRKLAPNKRRFDQTLVFKYVESNIEALREKALIEIKK